MKTNDVCYYLFNLIFSVASFGFDYSLTYVGH